MTRSASLLTLSLSAIALAVVALPVSAESKTTVNVQNSTGGNTVCVNGKCTTSSGGSGSSKVCVNGVCHTSEDGRDVNYQSEDGNTKVNISNNSDSTVKVEQKNTGSADTTVNATQNVKNIKPTIEQAVKVAKEQVASKHEEAKKKAEEMTKQFNLPEFFKNELASLKNLFSGFFGK